jgi:hypothetical protein
MLRVETPSRRAASRLDINGGGASSFAFNSWLSLVNLCALR